MAFWGVEVKPGKPFTHSCQKARGRLHISQATLGISDATKKTIVQCNIGKRSPVLLCSLQPNSTESCHLDLEFQESDDVVFSVLGPQNVYLTGYYVDRSQQFNTRSDTESFGVDIENSHTEESCYSKDDDNYEDSFIDDGEIQVFPPSPVSSKKDVDILDNNMKNKNEDRKQRKKKPQVIQSESEDEDGYFLSIFKDKKLKKKTMMDAGKDCAKEMTQINETIKAGGLRCCKKMSQVDFLDNNDEAEREAKLQAWIVNDESMRLLKEDGTHEEAVVDAKKIVIEDIHGNKSEEEIVDVTQNLPKSCGEDQMQPLDVVKAKKKRKKRHTKDEEVCEVVSSDLVGLRANCSALSPKSESEIVQKSKKRRKDIEHEDIVDKCANFKDEISKQCILNADHMPEDLVATNVELQKEKNDKKTKRKKNQKKVQGEGEGDCNALNGENMAVKCGDQSENKTSVDKSTLSNGLVIEELSKGRSDGKIAAPGKKVKIYYTTMLKDGCVFDSNVGKPPCKFLLGDKEVVEGWNIGIEGMHIGDKRRFIIPPSLGYDLDRGDYKYFYGELGFGENVPPNSWLVSEVELIWVGR